jgi:hypothetical protein
MQRFGERLLHSPHRIEEAFTLGCLGRLQRTSLGCGERVAGHRQRIAGPMQLQVDPDPQ